ncbi:MAG: TetR/AcrR family transcriptional regulator [Candidatus Korobacteraceae bacterium]
MKNASTSVVERLVEAAVQLFSHQGFRATTTRQIARLADVNETSLFRHFAHKQDLFWAALESRLRRLRIPRELQSGLAQDNAPELVLPLIIEFLVLTAMYQPDLTRLVWVSLVELRTDSERIYRRQLDPIFQAINDYVEHCVARGTLRSLDASLTTIALTATILAHQELYSVLGHNSQTYAKTEEAITAYSKFWLGALTPVPDANHLSQQPPAERGG